MGSLCDDAGLLGVNSFGAHSGSRHWLADLDDCDLGSVGSLEGNAGPTAHIGGVFDRLRRDPSNPVAVDRKSHTPGLTVSWSKVSNGTVHDRFDWCVRVI